MYLDLLLNIPHILLKLLSTQEHLMHLLTVLKSSIPQSKKLLHGLLLVLPNTPMSLLKQLLMLVQLVS